MEYDQVIQRWEVTREETIEEHRKMWRWIADFLSGSLVNPSMCRDVVLLKRYYFENVLGIDRKMVPKNGCWCCEYLSLEHGCKGCPFIWGYGKIKSTCMTIIEDYDEEIKDGLFVTFLKEIEHGLFERASITARQIGNLEIKEER